MRLYELVKVLGLEKLQVVKALRLLGVHAENPMAQVDNDLVEPLKKILVEKPILQSRVMGALLRASPDIQDSDMRRLFTTHKIILDFSVLLEESAHKIFLGFIPFKCPKAQIIIPFGTKQTLIGMSKSDKTWLATQAQKGLKIISELLLQKKAEIFGDENDGNLSELLIDLCKKNAKTKKMIFFTNNNNLAKSLLETFAEHGVHNFRDLNVEVLRLAANGKIQRHLIDTHESPKEVKKDWSQL